ncbi:MAG: hypothetical protein LLG20_18275 [Acidobacteriales bacterium]|nr:hypothetical protein [Terriglobales bacterium]
MSINRRLFLSTLFGTAAVAADPERALWKPGKLISIPPLVHVPKWHQFWLAHTIEAGDLQISREVFDQRYLEPAAAAICLKIEAEVKKHGREPQFAIPPPPGMSGAVSYHRRFGGSPVMQVAQAYDIIRDENYVRLDCRVKI